MKHKHIGPILAIVSFGLVAVLAACTASPSTPAPTPSGMQNNSGSEVQSTLEPPLEEADMAVAVPDFLTPEQQDLYRRALNLRLHLMGSDIEYGQVSVDYEQVTIGDYTYLVSQGRYSDWDDFDAVVHSVFTERFWNEFNLFDGKNALYTEHDGKLCFLDTSIGGGYYYTTGIPDEFRLDTQTDSGITFTLIGHYNDLGGGTGEREQRGYDYTLEFPIKMVLTDNGWRFDEFHCALIEEDEPN